MSLSHCDAVFCFFSVIKWKSACTPKCTYIFNCSEWDFLDVIFTIKRKKAQFSIKVTEKMVHLDIRVLIHLSSKNLSFFSFHRGAQWLGHLPGRQEFGKGKRWRWGVLAVWEGWKRCVLQRNIKKKKIFFFFLGCPELSVFVLLCTAIGIFLWNLWEQ